MKQCVYKNEVWKILSEIQDAVILLKEIQKTAFAIQYKRTIVNKAEINFI